MGEALSCTVIFDQVAIYKKLYKLFYCQYIKIN